MSDAAYGYIDLDPLEWLGEPRNFNERAWSLRATIDARRGRGERTASRAQVEKTVAPSPPCRSTAGRIPGRRTIQTVLMLMGISVSSRCCSARSWSSTTVSAVLLQHVRHIAIMKSFGGRSGQILAMYVVMVLAFGGGALLIGIPLSYLGARGIVSLVAGMLIRRRASSSPRRPVDPGHRRADRAVLAALYPVISACASPSRSDQRLWLGQGLRQGSSIVSSRACACSPATAPHVRNTFRAVDDWRSLGDVVLAGAAVVAIMSLRDSLLMGLDEMFGYFRYDVEIAFDRRYRVDKIEQEALCVPA